MSIDYGSYPDNWFTEIRPRTEEARKTREANRIEAIRERERQGQETLELF